MMVHVYIVGVFALFVMVHAESINFKNCDTNGTVISMDISPCTVQPCVFHKGTNASVIICFTSPGSSVNTTAEIDGIVGGIPVKFPMPNPNGCYQCGLTCPVTKGQSLCYTSELAVLPSYPQIRLVVRWKLTGDDDIPLFCVLFPVEIDNVSKHQPLRYQRYLPRAKKHQPHRYQPHLPRAKKHPFQNIFTHKL